MIMGNKEIEKRIADFRKDLNDLTEERTLFLSSRIINYSDLDDAFDKIMVKYNEVRIHMLDEIKKLEGMLDKMD